MLAASRPFHRLPFESLPEEPRRPHPYFDTRAGEVDLTSAHFGRLRIHYREYGRGSEPLLLVHGLMTSSYSWRYLLEPLGARFRLVMPDLPGAGRSDKPTAPLHAAALAASIGEFQAALGLSGCLAVGNSLGGFLCMRHALDQPAAFSRLVNIHSPGVVLARLRALRGVLSIPGATSLLSWWVRRSPETWVHRNVHYYDETLKSRQEAREYAAALASEPGARAFVAYLRDTMAPHGFATFVAELAERRRRAQPFPTPLLLLYSRQDPLVPPAIGDQLAALIPDAELTWLDQTSHFAHVDSPERVAPLLLEFLGRGAPVRGTQGAS